MKLQPMPRWNALVDQDRTLSQTWDTKYLTTLHQHVENAPYTLAHPTHDSAEASVSTTAFVPATSLTTAFYTVRYALRIARAATSSSSLQLVLTWVSDGVTQTETFAAVTGNTTTTRQQAAHGFKADAGQAISYALTYASTGATTMAFDADLVLEVLP
jgi:hypothetical protein